MMKTFFSHLKKGHRDHHHNNNNNTIYLHSMGARYIERITHIEQLLLIEKNVIDTNKLREDCAYGVPDQLRPLCWRLFMEYLPKDRQKWKSTLQRQRKDYHDLVENLIVRPGELEDERERSSSSSSGKNNDGESNHMDHPLAEESTSEWVNFFRDNEVLIQIDRDVRRLRPEIELFQKNTKFPLISAARINLAKRLCKEKLVVDKTQLSDNSFLSSAASTSNLKEDTLEDLESEKHWQVVERILFIYSKVNSGVKYVQGMNELIGPIYYVFATDPDLEWAEHAEADTFYCFQQLMSEIKDNFIKTLDKSNCGIEIVMKNFYDRLQAHDSQLYNRLALTQSIKPQFYAFRWILLLLSQEFSLPDLITLWDALLSTNDRLDTVQHMCLAMLDFIRDDLMAGDFSNNVRLLQNYPNIDIAQLISHSHELRNAAVAREQKHHSLHSIRSNSSSDASETSLNMSTTSSRSSRLFNSDRISALVNNAKAKINNYTASKKNAS